MKFFLALAFVALASLLPATAEAQQRWIGVLAVVESPLVNQAIAENGNDPARYGPVLRQLLDSGRIQPARGNYCFIPYSGGKPSDQPECFFTRTGVYTMWAPSYMVQNGKAMCVRVSADWPAIAGQLRYPARGGKAVNCYDFGPEADAASFARSRHTAAMVVVVQPRN